MKLGKAVNRVVVDLRKLIEYALDPNNPVGRHKARVFEQALGFTKDNYDLLLTQIECAALSAEAHLKRTDIHGRHYSVDLKITGPQGQQAVVRTGWLVAPNSDEAWLTTLYVRKR
jgi:predicted transcriptional regulator